MDTCATDEPQFFEEMWNNPTVFFHQERILNDVLNLISEGKYNKACHAWMSESYYKASFHEKIIEQCKQTFNQIVKKNNNTWNAWSAIDDVIQIICLFKVQTHQLVSSCGKGQTFLNPRCIGPYCIHSNKELLTLICNGNQYNKLQLDLRIQCPDFNQVQEGGIFSMIIYTPKQDIV